MTDRIADIPPLERKDGIILFLSRINEIERTVVLNRSERSCRLQLEPRERPLSREIPRGRLVKIFAYARTEESSFHGRPTDRERPLIGTPRSSHPLASLGILWPLIISELASNNHRHAMHPSTKLESSRTTAASIIDLTNRADVSWPHPFHALTNSHPLDEKLSKRPKTRPTVSRSISISIYTTQTVPPSLPLPPTVDPSITNRIRMCPVFLLPPPRPPLFFFLFFLFFPPDTRFEYTRLPNEADEDPRCTPPAGSPTRAAETRGKRGARPGYEWKYVFNGSKVGIVAPSGVGGPSPASLSCRASQSLQRETSNLNKSNHV